MSEKAILSVEDTGNTCKFHPYSVVELLTR